MLKIERGITYPLIINKVKEDQEEDKEESEEDGRPAEDAITSENIDQFKTYRMVFPSKLWPTKDYYHLWANYIQLECIIKDHEALNALYLGVRLFEKNVLTYIEHMTEVKMKKIKAKR